MSYSDIINAISIHGDALGKTALDYSNIGNRLSYTAPSQVNTGGVNAWSSEAYTPTTYRDIYKGYSPVKDPRSLYTDINKDLTKWDKTLMKGVKGISGYQMGSQVSPYLKNVGQTLTNTLTGQQLSSADWLKTTGGGGSFNLGPAAAIYGAFGNDQNPYTFTRQEGLGTTASTMMGAHQLSKLLPASHLLAGGSAATGAAAGFAGINPYVMIGSLLLSGLFKKKRKKKAKQLNIKAAKEVSDKQTEQYDERADRLQDMRDDMLSDQTAQMHASQAGRYANQYGGNYSNRIIADEGMKYKAGGKANIVAEFTGNELIVNDQDKVEKGLASGNYSMAAAPIRRAMKRRYITPGPETHGGNPIPVDSEGNIYAGGGKLKFKVKKGAGIYDHATDQFKPTMTDKEIAMTAYNNISKWESNGMA